MKILGLRDEGNLQRDLVNLSHEELLIEQTEISKELFFQLLTEPERRAYAMQVLASTGNMAMDDNLIEATIAKQDSGSNSSEEAED